MTRIERVASPLPRECSTTEPHGPLVIADRTASALLLTLAVPLCTVFGFASRIRGPLSDTVVVFVADVVLECLSGAGEGNRTLVVSLEGFCSTIELHPPDEYLLFRIRARPFALEVAGGGGWIRTNVGVSQQIYSLPPLTTRAPLRGEPQIMVAEQRLVKLGLEVAAKQRQKRCE